MWEVFNYRDGETLAFFGLESNARVFVAWVNKSLGGSLDYERHTHEAFTEEATSPAFNGSFTVTTKCVCGEVIGYSVDSIL